MKNTAIWLSVLVLVSGAAPHNAQARGGRGGGFRGGGGGARISRPSPTMSRAAPRPATRPATRPTTRPTPRPGAGRPSTGRPSAGKPGAGVQPGRVPSRQQLEKFLDLPKAGAGRPSTGRAAGRAVAGDAAAEFLKNRAEAGRDVRPADRARPADRLADRRANRPDRIENRQKWQEHRQQRRDEIRRQFAENHPRWDFWKDHPNWARWRWNRPYRWAVWGTIAGFFPWGWSEPVYYDYGNNVYYDEGGVYYGDEQIATTEEYAEQAAAIAESAPEVDDSSQWLTLGVFAITQDGQQSGPPPTMFLQLAVNQQGVIAGSFVNTTTDETKAIEGMVDKETQRSAWAIQGAKWPIIETGIANLTKDTVPVLVHFEDGSTQQWLLVRMEEPEEAQPGSGGE